MLAYFLSFVNNSPDQLQRSINIFFNNAKNPYDVLAEEWGTQFYFGVLPALTPAEVVVHLRRWVAASDSCTSLTFI